MTARTESSNAEEANLWPALEIPASIIWVDVDVGAETEPGGDLVLFNSETGAYHSLDPTAGFLWRGISRGEPAGKIVEILRARHREDPAIIGADVRAFIGQAVEQGLLVAVQRAP